MARPKIYEGRRGFFVLICTDISRPLLAYAASDYAGGIRLHQRGDSVPTPSSRVIWRVDKRSGDVNGRRAETEPPRVSRRLGGVSLGPGP